MIFQGLQQKISIISQQNRSSLTVNIPSPLPANKAAYLPSIRSEDNSSRDVKLPSLVFRKAEGVELECAMVAGLRLPGRQLEELHPVHVVDGGGANTSQQTTRLNRKQKVQFYVGDWLLPAAQ